MVVADETARTASMEGQKFSGATPSFRTPVPAGEVVVSSGQSRYVLPSARGPRRLLPASEALRYLYHCFSGTLCSVPPTTCHLPFLTQPCQSHHRPSISTRLLPLCLRPRPRRLDFSDTASASARPAHSLMTTFSPSS